MGLPVFFACLLRFKLICFLLPLYVAVAAATDIKAESGDVLLSAEAEKQLSSQREWLSLLHYHNAAFGRSKTYVDDLEFFVAATGAEDAAAELAATVELFLQQPESRCRYPARYNWLSSQLDFSTYPVSSTACPDYEEWLGTVDASSIVLVFAASYLNSPSSMYGHTFLRFDPADMSEDSPLLSYALNFGAAVGGGDASLLYAWRGIAGGYPGQFAASAYMEKLKEYSRLENRDLWEYRLALTPAQVEQVLAHIWELEKVTFDYYFFDENCSFRLLELLEVARPDIDLTSGFGLWAIPLDTVRVVEQAGLVERVYYRPSNQTQVSFNISKLDKPQQKQALELSADIAVLDSADFQNLDELTQNQVAYTAYKYLRYEANEEARGDDVATRSYDLLRYIASRNLGELQNQPPPRPVDPLQGHRTMMAAVGGGAEDGKWYSDIEWRLSYHDLLDLQDGYPKDTSLNMGRLVLRYRESDGLQLQRLDVVEITSTPPRDTFYKPLAWQTSVGVDRQWTNGDDELAVQGNGGVGLSYRSLFDGRIVAMLRARAEYNDGFRDSKYDVSGGGSLMYVRQGQRVNTTLLFESLHFIGGTDRQLIEFQQQYALTNNQGLRLTVKRSIDESDGYNEAGFSYRVYF